MNSNALSPIDFRYLYPPLEAFSINHKNEYIKHGEKKKIVRKIFHFVNYDDYENSKIKELMDAIHEEKIVLPPNWIESDTLKYVYTGKFKVANSIKQVRKHLEWMHNDKLQILSEEALELLQRGVIYSIGRDRLYRPVIVFDVHKINFRKDKVDSVINAFSHMLTTVYEHMFIPGHVENWIIIIDINNMSLMNVPFKLMAHVIECMSNNYVSTVERLFITNPSSSLFLMWKIIEAMMDPETVQKIRFIKKANFKEIQEFVADDQLQKKYGGQLEDLTVFWPPRALIDVTKDIPIIQAKKKAIKERLVTGCQLTNCLPEKKPEIIPKKVSDDIIAKPIMEKDSIKSRDELPKSSSNKYEPRLNSPQLSDLKMDSPLNTSKNKEKIDEPILITQNANNNNNNQKSVQSIADTNSTISMKNETFETTEIITMKNQSPIKKKEYEIISEKNEEAEEIELEKETVSQPKQSQRVEPLLLERDEKNIKCQPCKECAIF